MSRERSGGGSRQRKTEAEWAEYKDRIGGGRRRTATDPTGEVPAFSPEATDVPEIDPAFGERPDAPFQPPPKSTGHGTIREFAKEHAAEIVIALLFVAGVPAAIAFAFDVTARLGPLETRVNEGLPAADRATSNRVERLSERVDQGLASVQGSIDAHGGRFDRHLESHSSKSGE